MHGSFVANCRGGEGLGTQVRQFTTGLIVTCVRSLEASLFAFKCVLDWNILVYCLVENYNDCNCCCFGFLLQCLLFLVVTHIIIHSTHFSHTLNFRTNTHTHTHNSNEEIQTSCYNNYFDNVFSDSLEYNFFSLFLLSFLPNRKDDPWWRLSTDRLAWHHQRVPEND